MEEVVSHLIELRKRLLRSVIVLGAVFIVASFFANNIYEVLALPLLQHFTEGKGLIATSVPAPFLVPFKAALMFSFVATIPYLLFQIWQFIAPGLYKHERQFTWMLIFSSSFLFYAGALFAYFVVLPIVFKFFIYIAPAGVEVKPDINLYFGFVMKMFVAFGVSFEIPVVTLLLVRTGICKVETLAKKRPYVIVGAFVIGMLLTPPDIISQVLLAVPIWILFELGLFMARYFTK